MSFGAIYCDSYFGSGIGSDGWGIVYPIAACGASTIDSTTTTIDNTLITIDRT